MLINSGQTDGSSFWRDAAVPSPGTGRLPLELTDVSDSPLNCAEVLDMTYTPLFSLDKSINMLTDQTLY